MYNQNQTSNRWQSLDIIKTLGVLGALVGHIVIWWFGKNNNPAVGNVFYSVDSTSFWQTLSYLMILIIVHLLFLSAGATFYFYLKKIKDNFKKVFIRSIIFIFIGLLFGLNFQPLMLYWNVFFFYAFSILIIFIINKYYGEKGIFILTLGSIVLTLPLRLLLNKFTSGNYLSAILTGDQFGEISFYPFLPWIFLLSSGFLISYIYSKHSNKQLPIYSALSGLIIFTISILFFSKPLDLNNIFGFTSQIPINYIFLIFGFFILLISLFELISKKITFSKYNPLITIGRHILPVYFITIFIMLPLTDALKKLRNYENNMRIFFILITTTLVISYLIATFLSFRRYKK